ncbi:MAG: DUF547 domain-containing protein [Planctomycetota bacterium]
MQNLLGLRVSAAALSVALLLAAASGPSRVYAEDAESEATSDNTVFDYSRYRSVLQRYVDDDGMVDYKSLKENRKPLNKFVESIGNLKKQKYQKWSDTQKIAFLTNAYNEITIKIILDNYRIKAGFFGGMRWPSNSIRQISGVFDEITHPVMGRDMTLDDIEHETLRKDFNEPRIHLTLVCAAMSCPRLLNRPYTGAKLEDQFGMQAHQFVRQPDNFKIERDNGYVYISSIFKWFGEDFIKTYSPDNNNFSDLSDKNAAVLNYLKDHLSERDRRYLLNGDYNVYYLDYDWSLNEQD